MNNVLGVDEVGRGAFAGPLVVNVCQDSSALKRVRGLTDSKKTTSSFRLKVVNSRRSVVHNCVGIVWPHEIDELGMTSATFLAIKRALRAFNLFYGDTGGQELICDGNFKFSFEEVAKFSCYVKADSKYKVVSMASIFAKVYRDELMKIYCSFIPGYNFKRNVGYGTLEHRTAIEKYSACRIHRKIFLRKLNEKNLNSRQLQRPKSRRQSLVDSA